MKVSNYLPVDKEKQEELQKIIVSLLETYKQPIFIMNGLRVEDDSSMDLTIDITRGVVNNSQFDNVGVIPGQVAKFVVSSREKCHCQGKRCQ